MAPQKTMAASQQEQAKDFRSRHGGDQTAKPRKRKGKQSNNNNPSAQSQANNVVEVSKASKQQVDDVGKSSDKSSFNVNSTQGAKHQQSVMPPQSPMTAKALLPAERAKSKQETQVPKQPVKEVLVPNQMTPIAKQLSAEEPDDIDAGIELDGSSNSGSSVKDISEDNSKSASTSPVMAQSNVSENGSDTKKLATKVASPEQSASLLGNNIDQSVKRSSATTISMQELAANQQKIDADEEQLQQRLRVKQRKSSLKGSINISNAAEMTNNNSQMSSPQSPALCKICEQHVYQMERIMAEKAVYHKSCFRCHQCKVQLRVDNYSSHEGQVYCKAHHRKLFQPQAKLDNEDDVDIVAKSKIRKRQLIICENDPVELPKDVVRSDTKLDDGFDKLNLNLNNILEKFERGSSCEDSQSSPGVVIEKPSIDIKKTLMAFESNAMKSEEDNIDKAREKPERKIVKKLANLSGLFNQSTESEPSPTIGSTKPLAVRRSESLMMRLKKYESRISGEQVTNDSDEEESQQESCNGESNSSKNARTLPKKLTSLKNQWENGDITKKHYVVRDAGDDVDAPYKGEVSDSANGKSSLTEKNEELIRIKQQLARKKSGETASIKNIYENAIKEAQQQRATKMNSSDLSALNGFSTTEIQQQLLQNGNKDRQNSSMPSTPLKDHFQLSLNNKANKLKERFEQGLINNNSVDDMDPSISGDEPTMSKMEQLRQEKLEDLSIFTEGEIKSREARSMFQQIDRRLSATNGSRCSLTNCSKLSDSNGTQTLSRTQNKIASSMINGSPSISNANTLNDHQQQPIRLTNNLVEYVQ